MLKISTLENRTFEEIAETFNLAFSDYFFPIKLNDEQLKTKFSSEGGKLDLSVGVFENEKLVAFILHFEDLINGKKVIYNGGTGVIPEFRGNHLTAKMYEFILSKLKNEKTDKMALEVLTQNLAALKTYQNQGFKITRELNCFKGKINNFTPNKLDETFEIKKLTELNWDLLQTFWDFEPTWQNSVSTMNYLEKENICMGMEKENKLIGYLIYNPTIKRIHQIAVHQNFRNIGVGSHLLNFISKIEDGDLTIINVDSRMKNGNNFLEKRGFVNYTNQYEMEMEFDF